MQIILETCQIYIIYVYSGFIHQQNWLPRYNWNIVESGV